MTSFSSLIGSFRAQQKQWQRMKNVNENKLRWNKSPEKKTKGSK